MTKSNAAKKLMDLAQRLKAANGKCPTYFAQEIENFEKEIIEVENYLANIIDEIQSNKYVTYNKKTTQFNYEQTLVAGQLLRLGTRANYKNKNKTFDNLSPR